MDGLTATSGLGESILPDALESQCIAILKAAGVGGAPASAVARSLVAAEARGHASHGVARLSTYVRRVRQRLIDPNADPRIIAETATTAVIDGGGGFGHYVGQYAMRSAIDKAHAAGIGAVAVRNSSHFGIAAPFAEAAANEGCVGVATSNGPAWMAPPGTRTKTLGTNPLAIAVPGAVGSRFVLDMATSVAALGKILALHDRRQSIPEGWALTADGHPTTDSAAAAEGMLRPLGEYKGFGLALVLEVLSAVLSGARIGRNAGSMYRSWTETEGLGHFFLALATAPFRDASAYNASLAELAEQVRSAEAIDPTHETLLPGEIEARREQEAYSRGIPVTAELEAALVRAAREVNLNEPVSSNGL